MGNDDDGWVVDEGESLSFDEGGAKSWNVSRAETWSSRQPERGRREWEAPAPGPQWGLDKGKAGQGYCK